ncbi:MAG TPA: septation protein SepH, partial [Pseudonocardiaceae bacterium]
MRALRVIGLAEDGAVICETEAGDASGDQANPERFSLRADDRLRAAARGDLARLGQIEIELESQMRPREIQTRIRAGASVEQVAEAAGMPVERVDRFAYPVLLERSRTADLAQRAHPIRDDGPDVRTLGEVVANTFGQRGQDYTAVTWDSWKGEDGKWVVQLRWTAGRSDNRAHWTFHPGAHGGTVTVLDELAADLIDPAAGKPLRTVRAVTALAEQALQTEEPVTRRAEPAPRPSEPAPRPSEPATRRTEPATRRTEPAPRPSEPAARRTAPAQQPSEPGSRHTEPAARAPA